jgi:hypothetical protein
VPRHWWTKFPSLARVKGVSKFLHLRTHRDTIADDAQEGRGDRLQAIEEFANQVVHLKEQAHEEEKRILQRTLEHKVEESRTLASRSADLLGKGVDTFDIAIAEIEGIKKDLVAVGEIFVLCSNGWPSPCMSSTIGNCASTSSRRCRRQSVRN